MFQQAFQNKTVWLSGHTGFKGAWLTEWLLKLGARVHGFALAPEPGPALFEQLGLANRIQHMIADVRDPKAVIASIQSAQPDFVFHLAAQPLVRRSYIEPVATYATNVMGTIHVLEAIRLLEKPCVSILITTDKCYENREWVYGYREADPLGGYDPYSSSKAAAEIAIAAWRRSFFNKHPSRIASARAGNVIGGGDWAEDRIIPDCMRALRSGRTIPVRNKNATRPWQHVIEPLSGYLWLAARLAQPEANLGDLAGAFNFGPGPDSNRSVVELVTEVLKHWPGDWRDETDPKGVHEAKFLQLATDKARSLLQWQPVWPFTETVRQTVSWYRTAMSQSEVTVLHETTRQQIEAYEKQAAALGVAWACV